MPVSAKKRASKQHTRGKKTSKGGSTRIASAKKSPRYIDNMNPATMKLINRLPVCTEADVENAVAAARSAYSSWSSLPPEDRADALDRLREQLVKDMQEMIDTICEETGKTEMDGLVEIFTVCEHLKYVASRGPQLLADEKRSTGIFIHKKAYITYQSRGVIGVISPWNYPLILTLSPIMQGLMAGNTVVVKPSEITPNTSLKLREIATRSGLPENVLKVVTGFGETGAALVASKGTDMICFTGSTATGRRIGEICGRMLKPVILELGGKDPMIICADANLDRAVNGAIWGSFSNSGQTCISVERIFVEESVYEEFMQKIREKARGIKQGLRENHPSVGSMTFEKQVGIVKTHLADAEKKGARIELCGDRPPGLAGLFLNPLIVTNVQSDMQIMQEESFGPLVAIMKFRDEDHAVELANNTVYGLNASVWSCDLDKAKRIARRIHSGSICINDVDVNYIVSDLPFGGTKESGIGRVYGPEGLRAFTNPQSVTVDRAGIFGITKEIHWFPYTERKLNILKKTVRWLFG